jgi:thiol-disulfide isomerase/thioredoxin
MTFKRIAVVVACGLLVSPALRGQATETSIAKQIGGLRAVPDAQRPAATTKIAMDIRTLPAGLPKLKLAMGVSNLATEGDPGAETLQAVAVTLAQALTECPQEAKGDRPPEPYMELAKLARYEHITTQMKDPLLDKADAVLVADDADVQKADFTLKDLHGKKVTLSALRGKIVVVNFWATWCPPCRKEMSDLDLIYTHYQPEGLGGAVADQRRGLCGEQLYYAGGIPSAGAAGRWRQGGEAVPCGWDSEDVCVRPRREAGGGVDRYADAAAVLRDAGAGGVATIGEQVANGER